MRCFGRCLAVAMMALFCSVGSPCFASAGDFPLIVPMSGFSLTSPNDALGQESLKPYAQTDGILQWSVGAWNIPGGKLPPFTKRADKEGAVFSTQAPAARVGIAIEPSGTRLTLAQNGRVVPCEGKNNRPFEFDLFAAPNDARVKPPRWPGYLSPAIQNSDLNALTGLIFQADVQMTQGLATPGKHCQTNFGNAVVAVILNDRATHPAQVFFYQLFVSRFCGVIASIKLPSCGLETKMLQFFKKNPFGTDDYAPLAGAAWLAPGRKTKIQIDLRPRLISAIETAQGGVDQNLSHWRVGSMYLGQIIYGDVTLQSTWRNVTLTAQTPSD
jgi:hypothetical protein